jgi:hypothetical protein
MPQKQNEERSLRRHYCRAFQAKDLKATVYLIDLPAPIEELLAVTIDDTAHAFLITRITGFPGHQSYFFFYGFNIQKIFQVAPFNRSFS